MPELYTEEERNALQTHVQKHFGEFANVFQEIASPDIQVDIGIVAPTPARNFYTLVTMGMGAHKMHLPDGLEGRGFERAEMVLCLPPQWDLNSSEEEDYWPLRWLKILARLPGNEDTWLGWGHTVPNGEPLAKNTQFSGVLLELPYRFGEEAVVCRLPGGETVRFYQVLPLYEEEMDFKVRHGTDALVDRFGGEIPDVVNIHRKNVCAPPPKPYAIPTEEIKTLISSQEGCIVSDRIMVDGCKVGFCYREEPAPDQPDSGWRFLSGDETEEYLGDPGHADVYGLNTLCNYDPDVIALLDAPVGSAFLRGLDGQLHPDEDWQPELV